MMTVSNVINNRFSQMGPATRLRVERAIATLNYRPHMMARNLRRAQHLSIGVLFIDDDDPTFAAHPGHAHVIAGLSSFLNARGYSLTLQGVDRGQLHSALPVKNIGTDAICIVQSGPKAERQRVLRRIAGLGQPCVVIHETTLPKDVDACCVREDDFQGGQLIARHLLERGCRRILLAFPSTIWGSMEERERGIRTECRTFGLEVNIVRCPSARVEHVHEALDAYLSSNDAPDAIAAGNDQIAIASLKFLKQRGIAVPGHVKVTGFNAFEFWKYSDPLLTTIKAPAAAMGTRAGEELVRRLTVGSFSSRHIVLPVDFIEGRST